MTRNAQLDVTKAALIIAEYSYGAKGVWAYECFDYLNARYFNSELPTPHIIWEPTNYGKCLGQARYTSIPMPTIQLHPAIIGETDSSKPWGIAKRYLGVRYAFDLLLHELIHVHVHYTCGYFGNESHSNKFWIDKCQEITSEMGYDVVLSNGKPRRVNGKVTRKPPENELPYGCTCRFPYSLREYMGHKDYYLRNKDLECNIHLRGDRAQHTVSA